MAMGAGSKQPRPLAIRWYTANHRSFTLVAWCLAALVVLVIFHLFITHKEEQVVRGLEDVEEEVFPVKLARSWRNPPAARRKWEHRTLPVVDEFLVESSAVHRTFFPEGKVAVDPVNGGSDRRYFYYPGRVWLDTDGKPIQAHGGGVMYDEKTETYFWYGENKDGKTYKVYTKGPDRWLARIVIQQD